MSLFRYNGTGSMFGEAEIDQNLPRVRSRREITAATGALQQDLSDLFFIQGDIFARMRHQHPGIHCFNWTGEYAMVNWQIDIAHRLNDELNQAYQLLLNQVEYMYQEQKGEFFSALDTCLMEARTCHETIGNILHQYDNGFWGTLIGGDNDEDEFCFIDGDWHRRIHLPDADSHLSLESLDDVRSGNGNGTGRPRPPEYFQDRLRSIEDGVRRLEFGDGDIEG